MENLAKQLAQGEGYFGSGTGNTPQFNKFFNEFKKKFTKELRGIGASRIEFKKGHFELSGFFTAESGQIIYFSLGDVRFNLSGGSMEMMWRTAEHYKDFTGGMNQYQPIRSGMASEMLNSWYLA